MSRATPSAVPDPGHPLAFHPPPSAVWGPSSTSPNSDPRGLRNKKKKLCLIWWKREKKKSKHSLFEHFWLHCYVFIPFILSAMYSSFNVCFAVVFQEGSSETKLTQTRKQIVACIFIFCYFDITLNGACVQRRSCYSCYVHGPNSKGCLKWKQSYIFFHPTRSH